MRSLAPDFALLDVWRFPVAIACDVPFERFLAFLDGAPRDFATSRGPAGWLFRLREGLGRVFGWDDSADGAEPLAIPGCRERSLRDRLDPSERDAEAPPEPGGGGLPGFAPVYRRSDEALLEISNATVHALLHLGRVPEGRGEDVWAPEMAVYVKTRGALGRVYMAAIAPFRHGIVYPSMMRSVGKAWPRYREAEGLPAPLGGDASPGA